MGSSSSQHLCANSSSSSSTVDFKNPIHMGYLWKFCETEYSSENIQFIIDVDRLRDLMALYLVPVWEQRNWRDTDEVVRILEQKGCNNDLNYRNTLEMASSILLGHCATEVAEVETSYSTKICKGRLGRNGGSIQMPVAGHRTTSVQSADMNRRESLGVCAPNEEASEAAPGPASFPNDHPGSSNKEHTSERASASGRALGGRIPFTLSAKDKVKAGGVWAEPPHLGFKQPRVLQGKGSTVAPSSVWPRNLAGKDLIDREIDRIWWTYLVDEAPRQVCVSQGILDRTRIRAKYFSLYGPDIFAEALLDPYRTMRADIVGRFMKSPECQDMFAFLSKPAPGPLPAAMSCADVPPATVSLFTYDDEDFLRCRSFSLRELVVDRYLYQQFHAYLSPLNMHVPLLGVRLLTIFEERVLANDHARAEEVAWQIYRYFVAKGAPHEVPLGVMDHKVVLLALTKPFMGMFKALKMHLCAMLVKHFEKYKLTEAYRSLHKVVIEILKKQGQNNQVIVKGGFRLWQ